VCLKGLIVLRCALFWSASRLTAHVFARQSGGLDRVRVEGTASIDGIEREFFGVGL
jgi:hypothetical protein